MPILVATIVTVVVFAPVVFLSGMGKFLFTPLALSVTFAMIASYAVAFTVIPVYCARILRAGGELGGPRWFQYFERAFERCRTLYGRQLRWTLNHKAVATFVLVAFLGVSALLALSIGTELFPQADTGQFTVHMRAPSGTRIERTEQHVLAVDRAIRETIPPDDLQMIIANSGVLYDWPAAYTPNAGPMDAFLMVQLNEDRRTPSQAYAQRLRRRLREQFPLLEFSFETGGLLSSAMNFGLPSPINIQVEGNRLDIARRIAREVKAYVEAVPGAVDVRIKQKLDYPELTIDIDRTKAAFLGLNAEEVVKNVVTSLNSSVNFDPAFWIDEANGNHYFVGAQYREEAIDSLDTLLDIPITGARQKATGEEVRRAFRPAPHPLDGAGKSEPVRLRNIAGINRTFAPSEVNHHNISRVTDVYANVEGRDIGSMAAEIERRLAGKQWPEGYRVNIRGEVSTMRESFAGLSFGLGLAVVLIYFVMVVLFRSYLDPIIVMLSVPLGLAGVVWILFLTGTTLLRSA